MSKLEGNGRWASKMALTEHVEQYEARNGRKLSKPTPEELTMIRDSIMLPYLLAMAQKSIEELNRSSNVLKRLYSMTGQWIMDRISKDLYDLRREMSRRNIKIVNEEQVDTVLYHRFICRGYEERFGIVREVMRAQMSERLAKYVSELAETIKADQGSRHP